jgi:hypothetical protein
VIGDDDEPEVMAHCPVCGDELGDFSACSCALESRRPTSRPGGLSAMRAMVDRKLRRQGKR